MTCQQISPPPSVIKLFNDKWINWFNEIYKKISGSACHGSMYQYELGTVITVSASNTYYPITSMSEGKLNGFTFASDQLTVSNEAEGRYLVNLEVSYSDGGNTAFEVALLVNSVVNEHSAAHAGTTGSLNNCASGTGFVDLVGGDVLELGISNHSNTNNATIEHASLTLLKIG